MSFLKPEPLTLNPSIKIDNHKFYTKAIKEHGVSAKGVRWHSKETQFLRFEVLSEFIKDDIKESVVVDAGCGFGDYYTYLCENLSVPYRYVGYDMLDEMITISKKRFFDVEFKRKDILKDELIEADYYVCSGAMNTLSSFDALVFIKRCFEHSKKGFAFNLLKDKTYNSLKIDDVVEYCSRFCDSVTVKDGYLDNDISFFLKSDK